VVEKGARLLKVCLRTPFLRSCVGACVVVVVVVVVVAFGSWRFPPRAQPGGVIVSYGMTLGPTLPFSMAAVLKNIELRGSTMGSRAEFRDMIAFVREHRIRPVISRVVKGLEDLEAIDGLFEDMKTGKQFGKLVVEIGGSEGGEGGEGAASKLWVSLASWQWRWVGGVADVVVGREKGWEGREGEAGKDELRTSTVLRLCLSLFSRFG